MSRLQHKFKILQQTNQAGLIGFITAGFNAILMATTNFDLAKGAALVVIGGVLLYLDN